ncbi:hypothetical protein KIPB_004437, partial [Kipferlia bialata]
GDLVLEEAPLLRVKSTDETIQAPFSLLTEREQGLYMELEDVHRASGGPKTPEGIWKTNAYSALDGNSHVFHIISRFNHSCAPNLMMSYPEDGKHLCMCRMAVDVCEGEELTLCYADPWECRADRQSTLSRYEFTCGCQVCSLSGDAHVHSDTMRERAGVIKGMLGEGLSRRLSMTSPQELLDEVEEYLEIYRTELGCDPAMPFVLERALVTALLCGEPEWAQKYADEALRVKLLCEGDHPGVQRYRRYAECPSTHPGALTMGVGPSDDSISRVHSANPREVVDTPTDNPFEIVTIEDDRLGVVATRDIVRGELILEEAPVLSLSSVACRLGKNSGASIGSLILERLSYNVSADKRDGFWGLRRDISPIGTADAAESVYECNRMAGDGQSQNIYLLGSRFNHSCLPNVINLDMSKEHHMSFRALRDIEEGEELTVCYFDSRGNLTMDQHERESKLMELRGVSGCGCELCSLSGSALKRSAKKRLHMQAIYDSMGNRDQEQLAKLQELIAFIEEDMQNPHQAFEIHHRAMLVSLDSEPDADSARFHATQALRCKMLCEGDHAGLHAYKRWAECPSLAHPTLPSETDAKPLDFPYVSRDPEVSFAHALRQHEEEVEEREREEREARAMEQPRSTGVSPSNSTATTIGSA